MDFITIMPFMVVSFLISIDYLLFRHEENKDAQRIENDVQG